MASRFILLPWLVVLSSAAFAQELRPRSPLPTSEVRALPIPSQSLLGSSSAPWATPPGEPGFQLIVKFVDDARVRVDESGKLTSMMGADLSEIEQLRLELALPLGFSPLIQMPVEELAELEARAAARSGAEQADLAGMMTVHVPGMTTEQMERVGNRLQTLPVVEWAYIQTVGVPPPGDIAPPTRNLVPNQTYRGPNPGINVDYAWSIGARGVGVRLSDCEYGWDPDHEDLNDIDIHIEPGQTIPSWVYTNGWQHHGTAVLGETVSQDNSYGCSGIAPQADVYTWPEWSDEEGGRRVTCITHAIASSDAGDVVLLEMQTTGAGGGYGPAELDPAVWTVTQTGTDAGVIVVGAAGNGSQNLDSSAYDSYRARGDSGAIIVGAGTANMAHSRLSFSTYGARVNVQGWGESVFTLGYGSFAQYGGDTHQAYTSSFNGTSSASPFVAGTCVAIQSYALAQAGVVLSPTALRDLLIATGIPQGGGAGHIGPLVDLRGALDALDLCPAPSSYCVTSPNSAGPGAVIGSTGTTSVASNDLVLNASGAVPNQFGLFFYGPTQIQVPFGDGFQCVGAGGLGLFRIRPPIVIDSFGIVTQPLDYTQPPLDSGAGKIQAGGTWYWQFWFRDPTGPGGTGFNTSDGLSVTFCP